MSTFSVTLGNREHEGELTLEYRVYPTPIARRWAKLIRRAIAARKPIDHGGNFYGRALKSEPELIQDMLDAIATIEATKPADVPFELPFPPKVGMSREELLQLHEIFERIGVPEHFDRFPEAPINGRSAVLALNVVIHQVEQHRIQGQDGWMHIQATFPTGKWELAAEDFSQFTTEMQFGRMYLGYCTTGVPVLEAFKTQAPQLPVPQSRFNEEFLLWFRPPERFEGWDELDQWTRRKLGCGAREPSLALGFIPLGELISPAGLPPEELVAEIQRFDFIRGLSISDLRFEDPLNKVREAHVRSQRRQEKAV